MADSGFNSDEVVRLWDKANYEDWAICELNQRGILSKARIPGPYAIDEEVLFNFDRYVIKATNGKH
jgi:Rieske 2Fe-2S family protein